jgi:N-acetylglucosaminyl-diphospho-decaprenol L-rhamnosyltransferase
MAPPVLEIVIVSFRCEALLRDCLASLRANPPSVGHRTTVVDNASGDGTAEMVRTEFPEVRLIELDANRGFSHSNNLALRETEATHSLLLNPDTIVRPGAIDACLERIEADPAIGMVGCKLVQPSGELDHACKRSFPTPLSALAHFSGIGKRQDASGSLSQYRATHLGDDEPGEVDAVNGAFMLVRMEAVGQVGLLDEGYWLYMEDLDWCARFWRAGWKVFYEPAGTVVHVKGGSSGARRAVRQEVAFHRGMGRFYRRFDAPGSNPALNATVYAGIGAKLLLSLAITALGDLRRR